MKTRFISHTNRQDTKMKDLANQASHTMAANARLFRKERIQNHLKPNGTSTEAAIVWI